MDFDVTGPDGIIVTRLGAFDSGQDGILGTIIVGIVDRATGNVVEKPFRSPGTPATLWTGAAFSPSPRP